MRKIIFIILILIVVLGLIMAVQRGDDEIDTANGAALVPFETSR